MPAATPTLERWCLTPLLHAYEDQQRELAEAAAAGPAQDSNAISPQPSLEPAAGSGSTALARPP